MRYIIDRKTNEHERYDGQNYDATKYRIVEADSDGWIAHKGTENPLPLDCIAEFRAIDGEIYKQSAGAMVFGAKNGHLHITHYRPIRAEKVQEAVTDAARKERAAELSQIELAGKRMMLLDRLKAAHEAAQQIPDLEAELREVLAGMGYDLVARSPFVEPEDYAAAIAEPEPSIETPQGYALVPVEPTHKMLDALYNFIPEKYADKVGETMAYKSMLRMAAQYPEPAIETPQDNKYAAEW